MILPLQGDVLMGAVTPRALPWARRLLAFQAAKIAEGPYPSRQAPYPTQSVLIRADRLLTRGFAALPDAQRPYTAEGPYPSRQAPYPRLCRLARRVSVLTRPTALTRPTGSFKP